MQQILRDVETTQNERAGENVVPTTTSRHLHDDGGIIKDTNTGHHPVVSTCTMNTLCTVTMLNCIVASIPITMGGGASIRLCFSYVS